MNLEKPLLAIVLTSILSACGSGDTVKAVDPVVPVTPAPPVETVVAGKAIKGVLTNAVVTVYKFVDGNPVALTESELGDANISTDGQGNYSITVLDYDGPIKVELSPSTDPASPTTMTCDAPDGCGDIAYGQQIDLTAADPNFKLSSISVVNSDNKDAIKVNVSALTHLAAVLIETDTSGVSAESVTKNSAKIASTFGLQGDITQLDPTVTDDPAAMAAENQDDQLKYGLINAGIMSALFSGETSSSAVLSNKFASAAADLVANQGSLLVKSDQSGGFKLTVSEVLASAAKVAKKSAEEIASNANLTAAIDLSQTQVNLTNEQAYQEANVGDDGRAAVAVDKPTEGDAVAKAKAMVEDARLFTHLFDSETTEGAGIQAQGDEYITLIGQAGLMLETEANSFGLLARVADALTTLSMQYSVGTLNEAAAVGIPVSGIASLQDATGTITFDEETANGGILFSVDVTTATEVVELAVNAEFAEDNMSVKINISGALESVGASFAINEGSFIQINLDSAASREAFNEGTYTGEILDAELQLALALAQKATDTVANPVSFAGMLNTKLALVNEWSLNESWDNNSPTGEYSPTYRRPELEPTILPESLSLSGEFSSLEGDSIKAVLTVNVNDLRDYEAPGFKYIGKEIDNALTFTFSEDLNTIVITEADNVSDAQNTTETRVFTPGQEAGEWTATSSVVSKNPEEHYWGSGIERIVVTKRFDSGFAEMGVQYVRAYIVGDETNSFAFKAIRVTPIDSDGDGSADMYEFTSINQYDSKDYDGSSFETFIDADGNILTADGNVHSWDSAYNLGSFDSIDHFIESNSYQFIANPLTVTNGAELLAQTITNWWGNQRYLQITDLGTASVFFNDEELADIASGQFNELSPTAYLIEPLIKDVLTVEVSEDANTVNYSIENGISRTFTFSGEGSGNFSANIDQTISNSWDSYFLNKSIVSNAVDVGLDIPKISISIIVNAQYDHSYAQQIVITPVDQDTNGKAETYTIEHAYGKQFTEAGILVDENDRSVTANIEMFDYYDGIQWEQTNSSHELPFNPLTVSNALEMFKAIIANDTNAPNVWLDGIGRLRVDLNDADLSSIVANSTNLFDAYNIEADSRNSFEDEETFLRGNAALTLEALLGEYQVKLQLSGKKTALDDGNFSLNLSYRLPGEDAQRSITVQYDTKVEGKITAKNFEGVILILEEPTSETDAVQVIGKILVGPTAIVAATIELRDGLTVIVYSDGTTESL